MKSDVDIEMQGTVLFALLHLKNHKCFTKTESENKKTTIFQLCRLVETPTTKYTRSSGSPEALGRPGPEMRWKVDGEGTFHALTELCVDFRE